jgi:DNA-binding beta-propeller fold protein YncE
MNRKHRGLRLPCLALLVPAVSAILAAAELPNPYQAGVQNWEKLPEGRTWGAASALSIDSHGNIWVLERCGANTCAGRTEDPVFEFDASGKFITSFGSGMLVFPHGIFVDRQDHVWVTDADGKDGKGHQVFEFSADGKVLRKLGTAGVAGIGDDTFNRPSGVVVAPNGEIFVSDGHGGDSNARIVKYSKDGKFIKAWGSKGSGPGEFGGLHAISLDSKGRVFVADRDNNRIEIFDPDGKFLAEWTQFSRPSGIYIDRNDVIYVADDTSTARTRPEWPRGIHIGSAKDGAVTAFIPDPDQDPKHAGTGPESVVADSEGNVFSAEVGRKMVIKYARQ